MQTVSLRPLVSLWTHQESQGHCDYHPAMPANLQLQILTQPLGPWFLPAEGACMSTTALTLHGPRALLVLEKCQDYKATHWEVTAPPPANHSDSRLPERGGREPWRRADPLSTHSCSLRQLCTELQVNRGPSPPG